MEFISPYSSAAEQRRDHRPHQIVWNSPEHTYRYWEVSQDEGHLQKGKDRKKAYSVEGQDDRNRKLMR